MKSKRLMLVLLAFPALLVTALCVLFVSIQTAAIESSTYRDLQSISRLKSEQIESWLDERLDDCKSLTGSRAIAERLAGFVRNPGDVDLRDRIRDRIDAVRAAYRYIAVMVVDSGGHVLLGSGDDTVVSPQLADLLPTVVRSRTITHTDLYIEPDGDRHIDWVAPIVDPDHPERPALGAIVLRANPMLALYPIIQSWPSASETGESILVRQDGDSVQYISELRRRPKSDFTVRRPLSGSLPSVAALHDRAPGFKRGYDYGGVEVLAAYRPVRGTSWQLVAQVERDEVLRPMWHSLQWIIGLSMTLGLATTLALIRMLRQERRLSDLERDAEREQVNQQLRSLGDNLPNGYVFQYELRENGTRCIHFISAGVLKTNGIDPADAMADADLLFSQLAAECAPDFLADEAASARDLSVFSAVLKFIHADGTVVWHQLQARPFRGLGGTTFWDGVAIDVTERKDRERRAERLRQIYADLSKIGEAILRSDQEQQMLDLVCRIPVESGLLRMAWIGVKDPNSDRIVPRHRFGENLSYLEGLVISTSADVPEGRGITGTAWRTQQPATNDDVLVNPSMSPWRDRFARFGWRSSAAFPIMRNRQIYAVLTVYSADVAVFDDEALPLLNSMAADVSFGLDSIDAQNELLRSQARTSALIGAIPDLIFVNDASGRFLDVHAPAYGGLYAPKQTFLNRLPTDVLPADIGARFSAAFAAALASGEVQELHYQLPMPDGMRYFEARVMRSGSETIITIVRDTTASAKAETELAIYRAHLEELVDARTNELREALDRVSQSEKTSRRTSQEQNAILEAASMGIVFAKNQIILRCNHRLEELLGWGRGELLGQPTRIFFPDDETYDRFGSNLSTILQTGGGYQDELEFVRRDGTRFYARVRVRGIVPSDPSAGTVGSIEDITLERSGADAMRRGRELAEEATRMKSNFLANMSHEIRTPMNVIIGMTHLLRATELNARQLDYIAKLQVSSEHLLVIINDILDFSKIEAGRLKVEQTEFELDTVLAKAVTLVQERASAKGLELVLDVDPSIPAYLVGDPLRIGQILINYASNAAKFTERGEIVIRATLREAADGTCLLYCSVRDTGIGMSSEQLKNVFQSFQQADASTTRKYGGTGLGLAISKSLATLMEGDVGVESAPGAGSTFWFTARVARSTRQDPRRQLPEKIRGLRALVADDNAIAREVIASELVRLGLVVESVSSGQAVLDRLQHADGARSPFDVIILDWVMPGLDGLQTAAKIAELGLVDKPAVVLATMAERQAVIRRAHAAGIGAVLEKPITSTTLADALEELLGSSEGRTKVVDDRSKPDALRDSLRGLRVLLVEDQPLNRDVAQELLAAAGIEVDVAVDGSVAVAKVMRRAYDAVLMDIQMPVMDGLEATRAIRRLPEGKSLPIIAMTANAMQSDRERCLQVGMNAHVAKPIDPDDLWSKLSQWTLGRPRVAPAPAGAAPVAPAAAAATPAEPARRLDLDGVAGLDVSAGLARVGGARPLYESLLEKFVRDFAETDQQIAHARGAGDDAAAGRIVHSLRGVAATLGAVSLAERAGAAEAALRAPSSTDVGACVNDLSEELRRLILVLRERFSGRVEDAGAPVHAVHSACDELRELLASGSYRTISRFDALAPFLKDGLGPQYEGVAEAIGRFDFERALQRLEAARVGIGGTR